MPRSRGVREYVGLGLKGMAMGSADVVPGVSGGTIALITGIYVELIESIRGIARPPFLRALAAGRLIEALRIVNAPFLVSVLGGALLAVVALAQGIGWLIESAPTFVWSFFFGLVAASVVVVSRRVAAWTAGPVVAFLLGTAAAYSIVGLTPAQTPESYAFLFFSGAIAICALVLPGISGAFILLLLGKYQFMLNALSSFDVPVILVFVSGMAVGVLSFAQVLGWLFRRFHDVTIAVLCGFMLGSLRKIWPWKHDTADAELEELGTNALPQFLLDGRPNPEVMIAILLTVTGFMLVVTLARFDADRPPRPR